MSNFTDVISSVNTMWVLIGAALVFFMQAGFAMVETGFTRAKNAGNIIMKNLMDFCIGTPVFWIIGFSIMFGSQGKFIGSFAPMLSGDYSAALPEGVPLLAYVIFQTVFCATAATIVSGSMAERTKFSSYCLYSLLISLFVYPVEGHWIWGGGWLAQLGFHDFAGSTAVHMTGGIAALIGAKILGPRIGKYDKNGKPKAIPGHSLTLGALGVFILWFCWFGFNGCSTVSMSNSEAILSASKIFVTTNLSAACATCVVMIATWIRYKKPDVSMTLNGSLAGLVAITAGCDTVSPLAAAIIGCVAGLVVMYGIEFVDKVLKIDDPVGAVGVHGMNGAFGTLAVGLLSDGAGTDGLKGLLTGGGFKLLGIQLIGMVAVIAWVGILMVIIFQIIKHTVGLRVTEEEEILGLDSTEHGLESSYADFMMTPNTVGVVGTGMTKKKTEQSAVKKSEAVPVQLMQESSGLASDVKMTKISIICNQNKFEELKAALSAIEVSGITVTQVLGCGVQKGNKAKYYRGVEMDMILLPKIKVEVIVSKVPVKTVIDTATNALYTGHIGDGKIFVYDVENVVKVRTGEEGFDALQGSPEDFF